MNAASPARRPTVAVVLLVALLLVGCRQQRAAAPVMVNAPASQARQASVDAGHETWRTDPMATVRSEAHRFGAPQDWTYTRGEERFDEALGRWRVEIRATDPRNPARYVIFQVSQPARQGPGGIWIVHEVTRSAP